MLGKCDVHGTAFEPGGFEHPDRAWVPEVEPSAFDLAHRSVDTMPSKSVRVSEEHGSDDGGRGYRN